MIEVALAMPKDSWDRTEDDASRAFAASAAIARQHSLPPSLLQYCWIDPPESASDMLQDSSVLGLDFARSSEGANILSFRLLGPYWDRWMLLRFIDVFHFDSERPNLFNISALHWPEFFTPKVGCEPVPAYIDALPEDAIGCHLYTLSLRTRYTVIARDIEFISRVILQQKTMRDFRIAENGDWVLV